MAKIIKLIFEKYVIFFQSQIFQRYFIHLFYLILFTTQCLAITLFTEKEALRYVFSEADEIITETRFISTAMLEKIKNKLDIKLTFYRKNKILKNIENLKEITFFIGKKEKKITGVALILNEPGRWGPVTFIVCLEPAGKVINLAVMKYKETRGRPIVRKSFLRQFIGKTGKAPLKLNKDITAISGATVSSEVCAFTVKKAIVLYEEVYLKGNKK